MKYNYVFLNGYDGWNMPSYNEDGYYSICLKDLWNIEDVLISNMPLDYACSPLRVLYKVSNKLNLSIEKFFYPYFFKNTFKNKEKKYCFVIIGYMWPMQYYKWLKEKYPNAVFVRFTRDLISTQQRFFDDLKATGVVDYWITYDENEAQKYGMLYHSEIESKIALSEDVDIKYDIFFAGRAKKRLNRILEVYDVLENYGLNCFFYIMSAKDEEKVEKKGIVYSDKPLTYRQMLDYNNQSRCLLEVNQEGAVGYTSRFIEAVMYNKLLLTDNMSVKDTPFYKSNYIQCFEEPKSIDCAFINDIDDKVDYNYNSEFSPLNFINYLEDILKG